MKKLLLLKKKRGMHLISFASMLGYEKFQDIIASKIHNALLRISESPHEILTVFTNLNTSDLLRFKV